MLAPIEWPRADPQALASFDPRSKCCTMNCGPSADDPRSAAERLLLCGDCVLNEPTGDQMDTGPIATELRNTAAKVKQVEVQSSDDFDLLRDAGDLLRVLANLMDGKPPIKAFGPPGDWGYETELGKAVIALRAGTCVGAADRPVQPVWPEAAAAQRQPWTRDAEDRVNDLLGQLATKELDQQRTTERLADALFVLGMVDKNNRIDAGEKGKAWNGTFVEDEVRRVLAGGSHP